MINMEDSLRDNGRKSTAGNIAQIAIFTALTFALTLICIPGPRGGFVHFGNIPAFAAAILLSRKNGWIPGAIGMTIYDLAGGFLIWAPFTFVIRLLMGLVLSTAVKGTGGKSAGRNALGMLLASAVMIAGYYLAEVVIYGNPVSPVMSIPGNVIQLAIGIAGALLVVPAMRRIKGRRRSGI